MSQNKNGSFHLGTFVNFVKVTIGGNFEQPYVPQQKKQVKNSNHGN